VAAISAPLISSNADAQIVIGRGFGGISVNVPGVGGIRLGAPLRTRGVIIAPYGVAPYGYNYGALDNRGYYGPTTRYAARPIGSNRYGSLQSLPTAVDLQAMDDSQLLNAIVGLTAQLDADLDRFDTADTWRRYLSLPEDALPPANDDGRVMLGRDSLREALKRFNLTAANSRYVQISGLPSYIAAHAALEELVRRFGDDTSEAVAEAPKKVTPPPVPTPPWPSPGEDDEYQPQSIEMRNLHAAPARTESKDRPVDAQPASTSRPAAEELPAPTPSPSLVPPRNGTKSERSILAR
jgi:hypothetical protein